MAVGELSHDFTRDFLAQFQVPVDLIQAGSNTSVPFLNRWAFSRAIYTFPVS